MATSITKRSPPARKAGHLGRTARARREPLKQLANRVASAALADGLKTFLEAAATRSGNSTTKVIENYHAAIARQAVLALRDCVTVSGAEEDEFEAALRHRLSRKAVRQ